MRNLRLKLLCVAALAIIGYVVLLPSQSNDAIAPPTAAAAAARPAAPLRSAPAVPSMRHAFFELTGRVAADANASALFAAHSWFVAPPPPPPPPPAPVIAPPAPTAPPLPFVYMGSYAPTGVQPVYFLTQGDRVYEAKVGDVLDNLYSVDGLKGGNLLFTYKPLNVQQSLAVEVTQ